MSASSTRHSASGGDPLKATIAANLRQAQKDSELSNQQMADAVGAHPRLYVKWKQGDVTPGHGYMLKLAEALGQDVSWFYVNREQDGQAA